jgi:hypothetical protein
MVGSKIMLKPPIGQKVEGDIYIVKSTLSIKAPFSAGEIRAGG